MILSGYVIKSKEYNEQYYTTNSNGNDCFDSLIRANFYNTKEEIIEERKNSFWNLEGLYEIVHKTINYTVFD